MCDIDKFIAPWRAMEILSNKTELRIDSIIDYFQYNNVSELQTKHYHGCHQPDMVVTCNNDMKKNIYNITNVESRRVYCKTL